MPKDKNSEQKDSLEFHSCLLLNISTCEYTENNKNFVVTLYNPTSRPLTTHVRLPVRGASYRVKDYLGAKYIHYYFCTFKFKSPYIRETLN